MKTHRPFKSGTRILVSSMGPSFSEVWERAKVGRVQKFMLPLPEGYVPVTYDIGGKALIHMSQIRVQP